MLVGRYIDNMNRDNLKQALLLAGMLKNVNAFGEADIYLHVLHLAKRLHTIDEQLCNGTRDDESYRKAVESVNNKLAEVLTPHNINWYHQSDPRGASLYVSIMKLTQANYNNDVAIY